MGIADVEGAQMARNQFEQVDEVQPDAVTLSLMKDGDREAGVVIFPASASGGRIAEDMVSPRMAAKDSFRHAVKLANEMKVAVVVVDPHGIWQAEWGDLTRYEDGDDEPAGA
jgi:hypothetical protein